MVHHPSIKTFVVGPFSLSIVMTIIIVRIIILFFVQEHNVVIAVLRTHMFHFHDHVDMTFSD